MTTGHGVARWRRGGDYCHRPHHAGEDGDVPHPKLDKPAPRPRRPSIYLPFWRVTSAYSWVPGVVGLGMEIQPVDLENIRSWGAEGRALGGEAGGGDAGAWCPNDSSQVVSH